GLGSIFARLRAVRDADRALAVPRQDYAALGQAHQRYAADAVEPDPERAARGRPPGAQAAAEEAGRPPPRRLSLGRGAAALARHAAEREDEQPPEPDHRADRDRAGDARGAGRRRKLGA